VKLIFIAGKIFQSYFVKSFFIFLKFNAIIMNKHLFFRKTSIALLISLPLMAIGQIETRRISFPAGKSSVTISSSVKGDQTIDYKINAKQGQELKVTLKTNINENYFNVLAPGSADEAIYIGSTDGSNKFAGTLSVGGDYTIRVYLMRNAARNKTKANFTLTVSLIGGTTGARTGDALVAGTSYNATGKVRSSFGTETKGSVMSDFGVIRTSSSKAEVHVTYPKAMKRVLLFENGEWTSPGAKSVKVSRESGVWEVIVNDYEHYLIPDEVITGG
jgi:hypothetical protein